MICTLKELPHCSPMQATVRLVPDRLTIVPRRQTVPQEEEARWNLGRVAIDDTSEIGVQLVHRDVYHRNRF